MKNIFSMLRRADKSQRSMLKFQILGFGLLIVGVVIALLGNTIGGPVGNIILIAGIACAAFGGIIAGVGSF